MLAIQEVGTQILTGHPLKFYVFCGPEYGIKERYIDKLEQHYGERASSDSVMDIVLSMNHKHLIPLKPKLYIIRYDETFVSDLSEHVAKKIESTNIVGTIVCIYEDLKHQAKLDKYLPNYTVNITGVSNVHVRKYLSEEFPDVPPELIDICIQNTENYSQARNMCRIISFDVSSVSSLPDFEISKLFGTIHATVDSQLKSCVASRDCASVLSVLDFYEAPPDSAMYTMLSTMLELEKLLLNPRIDSELRKYAKNWKLSDIYNMFNIVYDQLCRFRSSSIDGQASLVFLSGLLAFKDIPDKGVFS